jgi:hypothetical protein
VAQNFMLQPRSTLRAIFGFTHTQITVLEDGND